MTNVEIAKTISDLKKKITAGEIKSSTQILNVLKKIGVKINEINWTEYKDTKSTNGKYAISRKTIEGKMVSIKIGVNKFECFNKDRQFKSVLENFVLSLNALVVPALIGNINK